MGCNGKSGVRQAKRVGVALLARTGTSGRPQEGTSDSMDIATLIVVGMVIATALVFDFTNGFHDTANAMATSIATGALKPKTAVLAAGALNLVGAFLSTEVAKTISGGIINEAQVSIGPEFIFAGLVGAIVWNLLTWLVGLPSSSSHALFGGLVGAVIVGAGVEGVNFAAVLTKVLIPALVSPVVAGLAAFCAVRLIFRIVRAMGEGRVETDFRHGQTVTACLVALSHGTNDAQKTMGIITLALFLFGEIDAIHVPLWVKICCATAMACGTAVGGWKIVKTMGHKIFKLEPVHGFAAETSASLVIAGASMFGAPVSTTHTITASIFGVGSTKRLSAVHWGVAGNLLIAWALTIPAAALLGGASFFLFHFLGLDG